MENTLKKLTAVARTELASAVARASVKAVIEKTKAAAEEDAGTFSVVISTEDIDRHGESVNMDGWQLDNYRMNPVVLWAHDYSQPPIGICTSIGVKDGKLVAQGKFVPADANPFAQEIRKLYDMGAVRATSVGFIANDVAGNVITQAELLEFSFVPVPANPFCLTLEKAGVNVMEFITKGVFGGPTPVPAKGKGVVPADVSDKLAPENTPWEAPSLGDFTDKAWGDLSDDEKKNIAGHYAWAKEEPPETFGDLKLPHHRPSDGAVVWRGVAASMAVLMGGRGGVEIPDADRKKVYDHLAHHYEQFGKEAPEFKAEMPPEEMPPEDSDDDQQEEDKEKQGVLAAVAKLREGVLAALKEKDPTTAIGQAFDEAVKEITNVLDTEAQEEDDDGGGNDGGSGDAPEGEAPEGDAPAEDGTNAKGLKIGRVMSDKNRKVLKEAYEGIETAMGQMMPHLDALKSLHTATGSEGEGEGSAEEESKGREAAEKGPTGELGKYIEHRQFLRIINNASSAALAKLNAKQRARGN